MKQTILLVQSEPEAASSLVEYFRSRGAAVTLVHNAAEGMALLGELHPSLVVLDLHLEGNDWLQLIQWVQVRLPQSHILLTNKYPDLRRELMAKKIGCTVFLRQPFTPVWIERALHQLEQEVPQRASAEFALPRVRLPVSAKIILPFALLAVVFVLAAAYLISRYVSDSVNDRFRRQLTDAATLTNDWLVREENRLLGTLRAVANTQGLAAALANGDAESVRRLALPIAANDRVSAIELLSVQGVSVVSLRRAEMTGDYAATRGDDIFGEWAFVQNVLARRVDAQGDKFAGWAEAPWGRYFYVAGPVLTNEGRLAGVVLVGEPLSALARRVRAETLAHLNFYADDGTLLASTLTTDPLRAPAETVSAPGVIRALSVTSGAYNEVLTPWTARNGSRLGLVGTALARNTEATVTAFTQVQALGFIALGAALVIAIGWVIARHITQPLERLVQAARDVGRGNFQVKLHDGSADEIGVLVQAFNRMVTGLQEGSIYRDLLGRTVSPEVREQLRDSFAADGLRLEGQTATATVLKTDICGFTALSEKTDPQTVLQWLNEYFSELAPVISAHGGVIDKYEGDAMLCFFGVLPRPMPPRESAFHACRAALEMLRVIEAINARRALRGEPSFITGIGINTGKVTAGGLGAADRLNYTIIGDAVNTTQRLESLTRQFTESAIVISETTYSALRARQAMFRLESLGQHLFKGKSEPVTVYRLLGSTTDDAPTAYQDEDEAPIRAR
jgi:adenylate cyclase